MSTVTPSEVELLRSAIRSIVYRDPDGQVHVALQESAPVLGLLTTDEAIAVLRALEGP